MVKIIRNWVLDEWLSETPMIWADCAMFIIVLLSPVFWHYGVLCFRVRWSSSNCLSLYIINKEKKQDSHCCTLALLMQSSVILNRPGIVRSQLRCRLMKLAKDNHVMITPCGLKTVIGFITRLFAYFQWLFFPQTYHLYSKKGWLVLFKDEL